MSYNSSNLIMTLKRSSMENAIRTKTTVATPRENQKVIHKILKVKARARTSGLLRISKKTNSPAM